MTPNHITTLDAALTILFHVRRQRRGVRPVAPQKPHSISLSALAGMWMKTTGLKIHSA